MKRQLVYFLSWTLHFLSRPSLPEACTTGTPAECKEADFVPGYNLAGEGFDIVKMERKGAYVIDVNNWKRKDGTCTLCKNPFLENKKQKLPLSVVDWRALSKCKTVLSSAVYESSESLVNESSSAMDNSWKFGLDITADPRFQPSMILAGTHSRASEFALKKSKQDKYSFTQHQVDCQIYRYRLASAPPIKQEFLEALALLPNRYNKKTKPSYRSFINTYGTHFIKHVQIGGKIRSITSIKTCLASVMKLSMSAVKDCLDAEVSATIGQAAKVKAETHHCKSLKKNLNNKQSFHDSFNDRQTEITGGKTTSGDLLFSSSTNPSAYQEWMESLKTTPDMVSYALEPLHNLIRFKGPVKEHLKKALVEYILGKGLQRSCSGKCSLGARSNMGDSCSCVCHSGAGINSMCCPTQRGLAKLTVKVIRGEKLWGDYDTQTDGFVKVFLGDKMLKTRTEQNNDNPRWNQIFDFGSITLTMATELKFEVWDEDNGWNDDLLGSCSWKLEKGVKENLCALNHGNLFFSYTLECGPSLGGPTCEEHVPSPMSAELMQSFVSRNAVPLPRSLVAEMMKGYSGLEPPSSSGNRSREE
ncbi:perforin-1-like [Acipenser oxyrinchus oxyrinchus]|uniref:Perforin-1-like n=1 Tax=Acipenser oxyrinchus oxyrinchus TaxID=40147 RepID=A0AAD8FQL2_ACIOX|nr:perforin-1-like [Acipenser oxyrinchus oxyrinchus]